MSYTMEDFRRDYVKEHLKDLTLDELLEAIPAKELVKRLSPDELLRCLSTEQIESYLRRSKEQRASPKRKKKS